MLILVITGRVYETAAAFRNFETLKTTVTIGKKAFQELRCNFSCCFPKFAVMVITSCNVFFIGAIFPPNTVTEVAFASALARASMESEHHHYVMKVVYAQYGDSFSASKAGESHNFASDVRHPIESFPCRRRFVTHLIAFLAQLQWGLRFVHMENVISRQFALTRHALCD